MQAEPWQTTQKVADCCLVIVHAPEGITTIAANGKITVAPNPFKDELDSMNISPGMTIETVIFDLSGRPVLSNYGDHVLHLQNLKRGIYILKIRCSSGQIV